jgi:predicted PurR-regulated permease PerM
MTTTTRVARDDSQSGWRVAIRKPATAAAVLAVIAVVVALWAGAAFFVPVVMATTLAVLLWPAVRSVQYVVRVRALAAFLVLGAATALTATVALAVFGQISDAGDRVPDVLRLAARDVASLGSAGAAKSKRMQSALEELDRSVAHATGTDRALGTARAATPRTSIVSQVVDWSAAGLMGATKATFGALIKAGAIVLLAFFLLCTGDRLALRLSRWCDDRPLGRGRFSPLVSDTAREMRRFGAVTLVTNVAIGIAVALGFAAFGVPDPWTWGLVAGAVHFVPYAGLAMMMGLAAIDVYALQGSLVGGMLAMGYVAAVGVLFGTVLAAWLQGRASNIDSAIMFAGTIFFGVLWGGWGLVLGPLLVVSARVVLRHAQSKPAAVKPAPAAVGSPAPGRAMRQVAA